MAVSIGCFVQTEMEGFRLKGQVISIFLRPQWASAHIAMAKTKYDKCPAVPGSTVVVFEHVPESVGHILRDVLGVRQRVPFPISI